MQDGQTALYIACKEGHDQIVELLLKKKADVNHQIKVRPMRSGLYRNVKNTRLGFMHTMNKVSIMCWASRLGYIHQDIIWIHPIKVFSFHSQLNIINIMQTGMITLIFANVLLCGCVVSDEVHNNVLL